MSNSKVYCICDEYDEMWRYAEENGLYDQLKKTVAKLQFKAYEWNYFRLRKPYNRQFYDRWCDSINDERHRGCLDLDDLRWYDRMAAKFIAGSRESRMHHGLGILMLDGMGLAYRMKSP